MKKFLKWSGIVILGLIVLGLIFGEDEETTTVSNESEQISQTENETVPTVIEEENKKENSVEIPREEQKEETNPSLTLAQQNAIGTAQNYLDFTAFSKQGLIKQLEFDKFSNEDAKFAVENIKVDWNEQAVKSGKNYLDFTSFSRDGLIDQLLFDGFTKEQATFAVDQIGL